MIGVLTMEEHIDRLRGSLEDLLCALESVDGPLQLPIGHPVRNTYEDMRNGIEDALEFHSE